MDLYTTSFSFPRPTLRSIRSSSSPLPSNLALPGSGAIPNIPLPNVTSSTSPKKSSSTAPITTAAQIEKEWIAVQETCIDITTREGCLVTVTREQLDTDLANGASPPSAGEGGDAPIPATTVWNFHLSGGYQSVMSARGGVLREAPRDNRTVIKVPRTDILESPLATLSPLKADVRRRLDEIAADSRAHVSVLNVELAGGGGGGGAVLATADGQGTMGIKEETTQDGAGKGSASTASSIEATGEAVDPSPTSDAAATAPITYGLETERMCELVITGNIESVEIAKVRLLVMLDELVCDSPQTS